MELEYVEVTSLLCAIHAHTERMKEQGMPVSHFMQSAERKLREYLYTRQNEERCI